MSLWLSGLKGFQTVGASSWPFVADDDKQGLCLTNPLFIGSPSRTFLLAVTPNLLRVLQTSEGSTTCCPSNLHPNIVF